MADKPDDQLSLAKVLELAGFGAIAAAVAVTVEDNPWFAGWLVSVAVVCLVARWQYERLQRWSIKYPLRLWPPFSLAVILMVGVGAYAGMYGRRTVESTVDEEARRQALAAQQQASDLKAEVVGRTAELAGQIAALEAQLKTAMEFQTAETLRRDEQAKRDADSRAFRRAIREGFGKLLADGEQLQRRCAKETPPPSLDKWVGDVRRFIDEHKLGDSYYQRFLNPEYAFAFSAGSTEAQGNCWNAVNKRTKELSTFIKEFADR